MIISTIGRYAVIVQLIAHVCDPAHAAPSLVRGGDGASSWGTGDNLRLRALQQQVNCPQLARKSDCTNAGAACAWVQGSCVAAPTPPPVTPPPTSSPVTPGPTKFPTTSPTTSPVPAPTSSPTVQGIGYCSDNASAVCWSPSECACYTPASAPAPSGGDGNLFNRARALQQSTCASITKRRDCTVDRGCVWNGSCVSSTPPPTDPPVTGKPTASPIRLPTATPTARPSDAPTGSPTPCRCLGLGPTRSPTPGPTAVPTKSPTDSPTERPTDPPTFSPTTAGPTDAPTALPTAGPSASPTTAIPTSNPTNPPTDSPVTASPTDSPSKSPTGSPVGGVINGQIGVPIVPHASNELTVALPPSVTGKLITLSQVSANNADAVPIARSYDGLDYETLHPLLLPVVCVGGSCTVELPPYSDGPVAMHYILREYNPQAKTPAQDFARLLLQGTYGPTQTSLEEASTLGSAAAWVRDQMDKPMSLLRAHYRKRANTYTKNDLHLQAARVACEPGSRWNRAAFSRWRDVGKTIVEEATGTGSFYLKVDGIIRTEVASRPSTDFGLSGTSYVVCRHRAQDMDNVSYMQFSNFVQAPTGVKGKLVVAANADACMAEMFTPIDMPPVYFSDPTGIPTASLVDLIDPNVIESKLLSSLAAPTTCNDFKLTWPNFLRDAVTGLYYVEDRRLEFYDNTDGATTVKKRLLDGRCPQVPKTFLNEDTCAIRTDCTAPTFSGDFELNADNLRKFYEIDGKYVYRIQNLPLLNTQSLCSANGRLVRKDATGDGLGCSIDSGKLSPNIVAKIVDYLTPLGTTVQESKRVIDIDRATCTSDSLSVGGNFTVTLPGSGALSCWTHTYSREWSVFVMNDWTVNHPGNARVYRESKSNPIATVAEEEEPVNPEDWVTLNYPQWSFHAWNFDNNRWRFERELIGSWGDRVSFNNLPDSAKSANVITSALGGTVVESSGQLIEVCGSPGEVANDPSQGAKYLNQKYGDAEEEHQDTLDQMHDRWHSSQIIWNTVALNAPDQLRQRVAWALASIFVVTQNDIGFGEIAEAWSSYYDIFVRHAFGHSFFDILREVSYHPLMGIMLTYEGSKSLAYQIERNGAFLYPDENFAREIMQLFSIGLFMLNQDGTKKVDANGRLIPTYTNNDIMNFSRGWTNFANREEERDNVEAEWGQGWIPNRVDPMTFPSSEGRDLFPKQTLLLDGKRGYIGDRLPRCDSMPDKSWLRKGAVWEFREDSQSLLGKMDPFWWATPETWTSRLSLDPNSSSLYAKLCNKNAQTGKCEFQSTVVLDEDISCHGTCDAKKNQWEYDPAGVPPCECSIDEPRTVRLNHSPSLAPVWYEYKRAPCIQMAYPETGNMRSVKEIGYNAQYGNKAMCADSRLAVAGSSCCVENKPMHICVFKGERTTYQTAEDRCAALNGSMCSWDTLPINWDCGTDIDYNQGSWSIQSSPGMRFLWTAHSCSMSAQIDKDGNVAIIHAVQNNTVKERVGVDTGTYFGVFWGGSGSYPQASLNCGEIGCQVQGTTCICAANAQTTQVFSGSQVPTANELLSQLYIGAVNPNLFDVGHYSQCSAPSCAALGYNIYSRTPVTSDTNFADAFDEETIFAVTDPVTGKTLYISNVQSMVDLGGGFSFRNPPLYNSPIDPTPRDAMYETDGILQHYFTHPNTAPFIATKLIQHLITSNPSPRFVEVVTDAFRSGSYSADGVAFGAGGYGDMEATVAAIMLNSEARSATLDDDANHGRAREPLLKIMHIYRSMGLSTSSGVTREIDMIYLLERGIGQEAFRSPSVFSFFLSEYQPVGPVLNKGLVAPETQLFDSPKLIGFLNGLFSLPIYGLNDCIWWQGFGEGRARYWLPEHPEGGKRNCAVKADFENPGVPLQLNWKPPSWGGLTNVIGAPVSDVISDIDLLLTGGRLYSANRALLEQIYMDANTGSDPDNSALKAVIQHFSAIPEFHITNNLVDSASTTVIRPVPNITIPANPPPVQGYKAIVYLFMAGAADSFSMLVPTDACTLLHSQYLSVRGDVAIPSGNLLPVDASTSNQPCNSFGLHPSLSNIHSLYNGGDAAWVSNIGPLVQPLNKVEFDAGSKPVPQALFAHNTQTSVTQAVYAQDGSAGGVLGRIGDALNHQEGQAIFDGYSISGTPKILEGAPGVSRPADVLSGYGVASFNSLVWPYESNIEAFSENIATSIHGETFSDSMTNAIYRMRLLGGVVGETLLANDACFQGLGTDIANQFKQVARIIKNRDGFEAKRDVFYTQIGGFDTHSDNGPALTALLKQIDDAIGCFKMEMDSQLIWNNVTIVSASEFGRTLTSNGLGTDHAWGGNHFILGGSVKGGLIHGNFPNDLTDQGDLNIGRGRLIPTTPWEGVWNGLGEWFGVTSENLRAVLPNLGNFQSNIFSEADLFE